MTSTMRIRALWAVVAIMVILGGLAAASPFLINTRVVKKQISKQISDWMGLPVKVRGEPVVTVFPYLTVKLKDVQVGSNLGSDQPPLVSMTGLRAEMYWLPLILGKFEVRRFHLENPEFELIRDANGKASWDMTGGSVVSPDSQSNRLALSDISLGKFRISSGKAHYVDVQQGRDEVLSDINLAFDWPNTGETAVVNGGFNWREQPIQLSARSDKPMDLVGGGLSPLSLQVSAPLFEARIEGTAATMSSLQLEGEFAFETTSLRDWIVWLGGSVRPGKILGATSMTARSNLVGASVAFSDMALTIDNNHVDGVMQLDFRRERPLIQGTLASDELDLSAYLTPPEGAESLLDKSLSSRELGVADLDIRLSANQLLLGPVKLGRTAATLVTRDKQLSFSIGEAFAYGGRMEASLEMRPSKTHADQMSGHLRAKANGILAGTFAREVTNSDIVTGTALAEIDVQGQGINLGQIAKSANGDMSLVVTDGALSNFNLDIMQDSLEADGVAEPDALFEGGSVFDVLSIRGRIAEEKILIDGLRVTSGKRALLGTAEVGLADMTLDFPGTLALYRSADPATHSSEKPINQYGFYLTGSVAQPNLSARAIGAAPAANDKDILVPGVPADLGSVEKSEDKKATEAPTPVQIDSVPTDADSAAPAGQSGSTDANPAKEAGGADASDELPVEPSKVPESDGADLLPLKTFGQAAEELFKQGNPSQGLTPPATSESNGISASPVGQ